MNIFDQVKQALDIEEVLHYYGVELNRNKGLCPFHNDKSPSFSIKNNAWHCFTCNIGGSIIDFVMLKDNLTPVQAVAKLSSDFGLDVNTYKKIPTNIAALYRKCKDKVTAFEDWERQAHISLCGYFQLLTKYKEEYAPKSMDEQCDELYVKAVHEIGYVEYLLDIITFGTFVEKAVAYKEVDKAIKRIEVKNIDNRTKG